LDEEGNLRKVQGIPRAVTVKEISVMQLKKCYKKSYQLFTAYMEEAYKDKVSNIKDHAVLKYFEYIFQEVPGIPSKGDIDFYANLMPGVALVSNYPYRMKMPELKELQL
jgi:hypothetical protein